MNILPPLLEFNKFLSNSYDGSAIFENFGIRKGRHRWQIEKKLLALVVGK